MLTEIKSRARKAGIPTITGQTTRRTQRDACSREYLLHRSCPTCGAELEGMGMSGREQPRLAMAGAYSFPGQHVNFLAGVGDQSVRGHRQPFVHSDH